MTQKRRFTSWISVGLVMAGVVLSLVRSPRRAFLTFAIRGAKANPVWYLPIRRPVAYPFRAYPGFCDCDRNTCVRAAWGPPIVFGAAARRTAFAASACLGGDERLQRGVLLSCCYHRNHPSRGWRQPGPFAFLLLLRWGPLLWDPVRVSRRWHRRVPGIRARPSHAGNRRAVLALVHPPCPGCSDIRLHGDRRRDAGREIKAPWPARRERGSEGSRYWETVGWVPRATSSVRSSD